MEQHGFGVNADEQMAIELYNTAQMKGYGCSITGNTVTISHHSGYERNVTIINGKFVIKFNGRDIAYRTLESTIKGIKKVFDVIIDNNNKKY